MSSVSELLRSNIQLLTLTGLCAGGGWWLNSKITELNNTIQSVMRESSKTGAVNPAALDAKITLMSTKVDSVETKLDSALTQLVFLDKRSYEDFSDRISRTESIIDNYYRLPSPSEKT